MAIAFDAKANSGIQTAASYSYSHTVTGSNTLIVACVGIADIGATRTVSSITYAGVALVFIRRDVDVAEDSETEIWALKAPTAGTNTVAVTLSGAPSRASATMTISLTGVDQTTPNDANNGAVGSAGSPTVSVTTVADNAWIVSSAHADGNAALVACSGQANSTVLTSGPNGLGSNEASTKGPVTPPAATTMCDTGGLPGWTISVASFKPAAVAAVPFIGAFGRPTEQPYRERVGIVPY